MGIRSEQVLLFGSQAKGTAHEGSGIDLLIISSAWAPYGERERLELLGIAAARILELVQARGATPDEIARHMSWRGNQLDREVDCAMKVNRQMVALKLMDYLHHRITLPQLVEWAEWAVMDADFDARDVNLLREIAGKLGLADVCAFGMTWDDCEGYLSRLGYRASVAVSEVPVAAF